MNEPKVRITRLTKLDVKEIERTEPQGVSFEETHVPEGSHGEVTLFTAVFALSALSALAAYLLRKHDDESFEETVEIEHPDGRIEKRVVKWNRKKTEAPEADIIRQIRGTEF